MKKRCLYIFMMLVICVASCQTESKKLEEMGGKKYFQQVDDEDLCGKLSWMEEKMDSTEFHLFVQTYLEEESDINTHISELVHYLIIKDKRQYLDLIIEKESEFKPKLDSLYVENKNSIPAIKYYIEKARKSWE